MSSSLRTPYGRASARELHAARLDALQPARAGRRDAKLEPHRAHVLELAPRLALEPGDDRRLPRGAQPVAAATVLAEAHLDAAGLIASDAHLQPAPQRAPQLALPDRERDHRLARTGCHPQPAGA